MADADFKPGLEGVIAAETAISYLDVEQEQIVIRGYDLIELARRVKYIDVVSLLIDGALPGEQQRAEWENDLRRESTLPEALWGVLNYDAPHKVPMDVLRTGISALAAFDDELDDRSSAANKRKALRLLAKIPAIVANSGHQGQPVKPRQDLSFTANFLYMLTGKEPLPEHEAAFDQSLIVYSEHEMPNSTFAARVIASTQADMYGAITGAVASLKGTLHGGANEAVMHLLLEAKDKAGVEKVIKHKLAHKERIMGFGHRVYMKKMDPRAMLMKDALKTLSTLNHNFDLYEMCDLGEQIMRDEKGLYPNLDYYAAPVYYLLGIEIDLYTPIFLASRTAGLAAHVIEQHENNRLFRPRVNYTGPRGLHP